MGERRLFLDGISLGFRIELEPIFFGNLSLYLGKKVGEEVHPS